MVSAAMLPIAGIWRSCSHGWCSSGSSCSCSRSSRSAPRWTRSAGSAEGSAPPALCPSSSCRVGVIWLFAEPMEKRRPGAAIRPADRGVRRGRRAVVLVAKDADRRDRGRVRSSRPLVVIVLVLNQLLSTEQALKRLLVAVYVSIAIPALVGAYQIIDEVRVPRLGDVLAGARDVRPSEPVLDLPHDADRAWGSALVLKVERRSVKLLLWARSA